MFDVFPPDLVFMCQVHVFVEAPSCSTLNLIVKFSVALLSDRLLLPLIEISDKTGISKNVRKIIHSTRSFSFFFSPKLPTIFIQK